MTINKLNDHSEDDRRLHWEEYYCDADAARFPPSAFAKSVALEFQKYGITKILEVAAGNGRDSIFFRSKGFEVLSVDNSTSACQLLDKLANGSPEWRVLCRDFIVESFDDYVPLSSGYGIYARFFIHTLTEREVGIFFYNCHRLLGDGGSVFIEYRNKNDEQLSKHAKQHFRVFHSPQFISSVAQKHGFECDFEISGTNMAVFRDEDASVTRQIFSRRNKI